MLESQVGWAKDYERLIRFLLEGAGSNHGGELTPAGLGGTSFLMRDNPMARVSCLREANQIREDRKMNVSSAVIVFKESAIFFLRLLPYLVVGLFVGAVLEVALSRHKEVRWMKHPGTRAYMMVSLLGVGTPL